MKKTTDLLGNVSLLLNILSPIRIMMRFRLLRLATSILLFLFQKVISSKLKLTSWERKKWLICNVIQLGPFLYPVAKQPPSLNMNPLKSISLGRGESKADAVKQLGFQWPRFPSVRYSNLRSPN